MEEKETLFSRIYMDLKGRILTGQIPAGSTFPSVQRLREEYQIGFRTAREVTHKLQNEHYIEIQPRKAPVVCRISHSCTPQTAVEIILSSKENILALLKTLEEFLPPMLVFIAQNYPVQKTLHYEKARRAAHRGLKPSEWRLMTLLCQELLQLSGNPLFSEMYTSAKSYSHLPFFFEQMPEEMAGLLTDTESFLDTLCKKQPSVQYKELTASFHRTTLTVRDILHTLDSQSSCDVIPPNGEFKWNIFPGNDHLYTQVMQDLVNKITSGIYLPGSYLPHEAELAGQYHVSVSTIRKALSELQSIGFCRTFNAKGTVVLEILPENTAQVLQNPARKQNALLYLYALQAMTLMLRPAARRAALHFTQEDKETLMAMFRSAGAIPLGDILQCVMDHLDLAPMRVILKKVESLVWWGNYGSFHYKHTELIARLNRKTFQALQALQNSDLETFAFELSDCYRDILCSIRSHLIYQCNFKEAESVCIPELIP